MSFAFAPFTSNTYAKSKKLTSLQKTDSFPIFRIFGDCFIYFDKMAYAEPNFFIRFCIDMLFFKLGNRVLYSMSVPFIY